MPGLRLRSHGTEILRAHDLVDLGLALPAGPILPVQIDKPHGTFDGLFPRVRRDDPVPAPHLLGFAERPIDHAHRPPYSRTRVLIAAGAWLTASTSFYPRFGTWSCAAHNNGKPLTQVAELLSDDEYRACRPCFWPARVPAG